MKRRLARALMYWLEKRYDSLVAEAVLLEIFDSPRDFEIRRHLYVSATTQRLIVRCTRWAYRYAQ